MSFGIRRNSYTEHVNSQPTAFIDVAVDWKETPVAHVFTAEVPGLKKEELKVEIQDGNVLLISGEKSICGRREDKWHRMERKSGKFSKSFKMPANAKVDELKAAMADGVLTLTVPKLPKVWSVDIDIRT